MDVDRYLREQLKGYTDKPRKVLPFGAQPALPDDSDDPSELQRVRLLPAPADDDWDGEATCSDA